MNIEEFKKEIIRVGKSFGYDFFFERDISNLNWELRVKLDNDKSALIRVFTHKYCVRTDNWSYELKYLNENILRKRMNKCITKYCYNKQMIWSIEVDRNLKPKYKNLCFKCFNNKIRMEMNEK